MKRTATPPTRASAPDRKALSTPALDRREEINKQAGIHVDPDRVQWGTPRTAEDDPRFSRDGVPADAFGPCADAVFAVTERLSWLTWEDAVKLGKATAALRMPPRGATRAEKLEAGQKAGRRSQSTAYHSSVAAKTAGGWRFTDWGNIREILRSCQCMVRPERAAIGPNSAGPRAYTADSGTWDYAFSIAEEAAWALLVADQVGKVDGWDQDAFDWMTGPWFAAFGDPRQPQS